MDEEKKVPDREVKEKNWDPEKKALKKLESDIRKSPKNDQVLFVDSENDERYKMYSDSMRLHESYLMQDKLMGKWSKKENLNNERSMKDLKKRRVKEKVPWFKDPIAVDFQSEKEMFEDWFNFVARPEDKKLIKHYKSQKFYGKTDIMYHQSPDLIHEKIKPVWTYFDGTANSPVYAKPKRTVMIKSTQDNPISISKPESEKQINITIPEVIKIVATPATKSVDTAGIYTIWWEVVAKNIYYQYLAYKRDWMTPETTDISHLPKPWTPTKYQNLSRPYFRDNILNKDPKYTIK